MSNEPRDDVYVITVVVSLGLIIILPRVLRAWLPDIPFVLIALIVVPVVIAVRLGLLSYYRRWGSHRSAPEND